MTERVGRDVWLMDGIDLAPGHAISLMFESTNSARRQGVFVATEGALTIGNETARAFDLWFDTAPRPVVIRCEQSTSGRTVLYNIYEREPGRRMSQADTSGMLIESLPTGGRRYSCCDVSPEPVFDRLVFTVEPLT